MSEWQAERAEEAMLMVAVESIEPAGPTVSIGYGLTEDGWRVAFAGEGNEMRRIAAALDAGEVPQAIVPRWAVLNAGWGRP